MAAQVTDTTSGEAVSLFLLPRRSLSRAGLVWFLAAQSIAAGAFAALAAWRGNVLAPAFAVLELGVVAYCLNRVWTTSGRGEVITLTPSRLEVASVNGVQTHFHPYWARVRLEPARWRGWPSRLKLGSHGRAVEIGAFLNEQERQQVAQKLRELLRPMQERSEAKVLAMQGDKE